MSSHSLGSSAINGLNDNILSHVAKSSSQIACVRSSESSVSKTLSRTVRCCKVLKHRKASVERVLNRKLIDCFVELVQHQAAHSRELGELLNRTPCTRNGNNVQRIELSQTLNNFFTDDVIGFLPKSDKSALHFVKRKHPPSELSKNLVRSVVRILQDFISSSRWVHVGNSNRQAILGRPLKAHVLHVVHELNRGAHASSLVNHQN